MNKSEEYDDSDSSDADFCPEKELGAGDAPSEEEDDGEEEDEASDTELETKRRRKSAKNTSKGSHRDELSSTAPTVRRSSRQTEANSRTRNGAQEKDALESDDDDKEKSRSDALWADFLGDMKPTETATSSRSTARTEQKRSGAAGNSAAQESKATRKLEATTSTTKTALTEGTPKAVTVTEVLDFAGEEVHVERTINTDSIKENEAAQTNRAQTGLRIGSKRPGVVGGGGLGGILNQIGKKKKISVLEKTSLDWVSYKADEGIDEELKTHNKGKDGFLQRQDFLQRTDLRQFEIEKGLRQARRTH